MYGYQHVLGLFVELATCFVGFSFIDSTSELWHLCDCSSRSRPGALSPLCVDGVNIQNILYTTRGPCRAIRIQRWGNGLGRGDVGHDTISTSLLPGPDIDA